MFETLIAAEMLIAASTMAVIVRNTSAAKAVSGVMVETLVIEFKLMNNIVRINFNFLVTSYTEFKNSFSKSF